MSDQDWSAPPGAPPPAPMPDGSIPLYASYPPPGTPGGGPALPQVGWGPEFGADGHFRHGGPPRKHRSGLLAGLLLLGGVGMLVVIIAVALRGTGTPAVAPSYGPGAVPAGTVAEADDSPPGTPAVPSASQDNAAIVRTDGFYRSGVQKSVNCRERQIALATAAAVQTYYANLIGCLNRAWTPLVRVGQDEYTAPRVMFWDGSVQSPCTTSSPTSFYCPANRSLYLKFTDDLTLWNRAPDETNRSFARMWATYTAGHEFGHHLQQLTGILPAAVQLEYAAPDRAARLEVSRRIELQASCLGAAFMGANQASYGITGLDLTVYRRYIEAQTGDENNRGGPRDHGARVSHRYWAGRGFTTVNSANCNTFTASASKVS